MISSITENGSTAISCNSCAVIWSVIIIDCTRSPVSSWDDEFYITSDYTLGGYHISPMSGFRYLIISRCWRCAICPTTRCCCKWLRPTNKQIIVCCSCLIKGLVELLCVMNPKVICYDCGHLK